MHARTLVLLSVLPIALISVPAAAQGQRVVTRSCWSSSNWRSVEACNRSYDAEIARAARREAATERTRLRNVDNADRAEARARARAIENTERAREHAREASLRAQDRAWREADLRIQREERQRERQAMRSSTRPTRYQRW
jgi:hypothetical protein